MSKEEKAFRPVSIPEGSDLKESLKQHTPTVNMIKNPSWVTFLVSLLILGFISLPSVSLGKAAILLSVSLVIITYLSVSSIIAKYRSQMDVHARLDRVIREWNSYYRTVKSFHPDELPRGHELFDIQRKIEKWIQDNNERTIEDIANERSKYASHITISVGVPSPGHSALEDACTQLEHLQRRLEWKRGLVDDLEHRLMIEAKSALEESGIPRESREVPRESAAELKRRERSKTKT